MALTKCKECDKEISDQAAACPNCGCPIKPVVVNNPKQDEFLTRNRGCLESLFWVGLAIFLLVILFGGIS